MTGPYVHDPRHRYSYELRPDAALDTRLRAIAASLEADGLLEPGASTAPRFHPHLTLLRADHAIEVPAALVGDRLAHFDAVGTFGEGRIAWLSPEERIPLDRLRASLVELLGSEHVDPVVSTRAWTPHLTLAYSVPEAHRQEVVQRLADELPITDGRWATIEVWDLDVRPTQLVHQQVLAP